MSPKPVTGTRRALGAAVLVVYLLAAGWLVTSRDGWAINRLNLRIWWVTAGPGGLRTGMTPEQFAVVSNVLLFVPLFIALALVRPTWWWVFAGAVMSTIIESSQLLRGGRDASIGDVAANSLGAVIGVAVGLVADRILRHRENGATEREGSRSVESSSGDRSCGN